MKLIYQLGSAVLSLALAACGTMSTSEFADDPGGGEPLTYATAEVTNNTGGQVFVFRSIGRKEPVRIGALAAGQTSIVQLEPGQPNRLVMVEDGSCPNLHVPFNVADSPFPPAGCTKHVTTVNGGNARWRYKLPIQ